jgi:hypothetical protein
MVFPKVNQQVAFAIPVRMAINAVVIYGLYVARVELFFGKKVLWELPIDWIKNRHCYGLGWVVQ